MGKPAFDYPLPVGQINLPDWVELEESFREIFARNYYTNHGPLVREFDERLADYLGVRHAVCVTNGTVALMVALASLDLKGQVIVPAFTFPATAQAVTWAGLEPVLCDVDPTTHCLSAELVEPLIGPNTAAILGVHLWGQACDPQGLGVLSEKHNIKLLYDAAHGLGCARANQSIASMGELACFSFHATKVLNAAEGGCITTNDDYLAGVVRTARNFHVSETFTKAALRINGKMSEAQAAMGLLSLKQLDTNIAANRGRYERYRTGLADVPGVSFIDYAGDDKSNYQYVVLQSAHRDSIVAYLKTHNVLARKYFSPGLHQSYPFKERRHVGNNKFSVTDTLCASLLQLPTGQRVSVRDVDRICELVAHCPTSA